MLFPGWDEVPAWQPDDVSGQHVTPVMRAAFAVGAHKTISVKTVSVQMRGIWVRGLVEVGTADLLGARRNVGRSAKHVPRRWVASRLVLCRNFQGKSAPAICLLPSVRHAAEVGVRKNCMKTSELAD